MGDTMKMNCPHCRKPLNRWALLFHFSGSRKCPECNKSYVIKYDWAILAFSAVIGILLTGVLIWLVAMPNPVKGILSTFALAISGMIAARPSMYG